MFPLAPDRFSTKKVWVNALVRYSATMRALMSAVPPGANGAITRTGLDGQPVWPTACALASENTRAVRRRGNKAMIDPPRDPNSVVYARDCGLWAETADRTKPYRSVV